jgi:hypothetical protein
MLLIHIVSAWLAVVVYLFLVYVREPYEHIMSNKLVPSVPLIGEVEVNDSNSAAIANEYLAELAMLLTSDTPWVNEIENLTPPPKGSSLVVESALVSGSLEKSMQPVQRAQWTVDNCSAGPLYEFIITPAGFRVIDPVMLPSSLAQSVRQSPILVFHEDCRYLLSRSIRSRLCSLSQFLPTGNPKDYLKFA